MSDPYGQNPPSGQDPYSKPQQPPQPNPYGSGGGYGGAPGGGYGGGSGGGYGGGYGGQPGGAEPKTDGVSIASLVLSLLCCTSLIGLILGFVGLSRTKNGQRKGRGLAIAGVVIGALGVLAGIVGIVGIVVLGQKTIGPGDAKVGQCANVDESDGSVILYEKKCSEDHDAEIVGVTEVTSDNRDDVAEGMASYCATSIEAEDLAKLTEYIGDIQALIEDPENVENGDTLVCYVEPGEKLDKKLL